MAINLFQNVDVAANIQSVNPFFSNNFCLQCVVLPDSISFNNVALILSKTGASSQTASFSFGLFSMNGATLSLANSASNTFSAAATTVHWLTLATSATQNISAGNWFYGMLISTTGSGGVSMIGNEGIVNAAANGYRGFGPPAGPFFRGNLKVSTNAMPTSIATSDCNTEVSDFTGTYPYIVISA